MGRVGGWRWASGRLRPRVPCRAPLACPPHRWPSHARLPLRPHIPYPFRYAWSFVETEFGVKKGERLWQLGFGSGFKASKGRGGKLGQRLL